ncbi:MAG: peptidylprolyl isomerase [Firmicutes bacterium]|nr:peptidylprolyl isomerase [Bacillota bacterium]
MASTKQKIHWGIYGASALLLAGTITACGDTAPSHTSQPASQTVATVNGQKITTTDEQTLARCTELFTNSSIPNTASEKKKEQQYLIKVMTVEQWAYKHHVITAKKAMSEAKHVLKTDIYPSVGGQKKFDKLLKSKGLTTSEMNTYLAEQMVMQSAFDHATKSVAAPTTAQEQAYYKAHPTDFAGTPQAELQEIVVSSKKLADTLEKDVQKGQNFATLAKKYSTDKTLANNGGELGWTAETPGSNMSPSVYAAIIGLKKGGVTVVKVKKGDYDVIRLQDTKPGPEQSFKSVQSEIASTLQGQAQNTAFEKFTAKLEKQAHIKKM